MINARGLSLEELTNYLLLLGEKPYRGKQVYHWIHGRCALNFEEMTDLPKSLRAKLSEIFSLSLPQIVEKQQGKDGTTKFALKLEDEEVIETVLIPERDHYTLCLSTQVGCAMGCKFCLTARSGFKRNLATWEIISQVIIAKRWLKERKEVLPLRNIVFMGMGEPLANYERVLKALKILADPEGFNFSRKRLTLSTLGIIPKIYALAKDFPVALAISLHTADETLRQALMPATKSYPLADLRRAMQDFPRIKNGRTTIEYVLLNGINDSLEQAELLAQYLKGLKVKVNLIPFNPHPELPFARPDEETLLAFQRYLLDRGILTTIRKSKGLDISAACGQLRRRMLRPNSLQGIATEGTCSAIL